MVEQWALSHRRCFWDQLHLQEWSFLLQNQLPHFPPFCWWYLWLQSGALGPGQATSETLGAWDPNSYVRADRDCGLRPGVGYRPCGHRVGHHLHCSRPAFRCCLQTPRALVSLTLEGKVHWRSKEQKSGYARWPSTIFWPSSSYSFSSPIVLLSPPLWELKMLYPLRNHNPLGILPLIFFYFLNCYLLWGSLRYSTQLTNPSDPDQIS